MPAVFVGHGSPMNAIEDNEFHRGWAELAARLPRPKSVLCISAHWETRGVYLTASSGPETIHDFYGFPKALFDVRYGAPGDPALAKRTAELLQAYRPHLDQGRGLDHGVWGVLIAMYPKADVPIVQLSIDTSQPGAYHYELAKALAPLRDEGVLIVGSGNIVHNLRLLNMRNPAPFDWAQRFDAATAQRIAAKDHTDLIAYQRLGPDAMLSVPTPEHYVPLLYVLAQQNEDDATSFFNEGLFGSLSMRSVVVGEVTSRH